MSRSRKSSGGSRGGSSGGRGGRGGGGRFGQFVFAILVLAGIVAVYQIPYDPGVKGIVNIAKSKAENAGEWAEGIAPSIENWFEGVIKGGKDAPTDIGLPGGEEYDSSSGTGKSVGSYDDEEAVSGAMRLIENDIDVAEAGDVAYDRDEWKHWTTVRSCLDTRQAVLIRDAIEGSLVMEDKSGKETKDASKGCKVVSGEWNDLFTGKKITDPSSLDIDHFIPLKYAATHNGQSFSAGQKEEYANDMNSHPYHLIAVSAGENRSKGAKGPSEYLPPNKAFHCSYAVTWTEISNNYNLSISSKDKETITSILSAC